MVLRKPYALLIKHFRLIHIILTGLMIFLVIKSNSLVKFFNFFIKSGYVVNEVNLARSYINFLMYLATILIFIICVTIYFLMKTKEKPTRLYIFTILYYIFMFIMFFIMHNALISFETELIESTTARIYRDLSIIIMIPQFIFTILYGIRAIGFDLKKFNFNKDLQELKIEAQDNEEFEIAVDREDYKIKRSLRRNYRELKYYFLENKFILLCILIVLITIIATSLYLNSKVFNKKYQIDQSFISNNIKLKFGNSYITNLSYNGDKLSNDKYYLVVEVRFTNLLPYKKALDLENYRLLVNNQSIIPTTTRNEHFIDLGNPYNKEKLVAGSDNQRLLIYEIGKEDLKDNFTIRILNSINVNAGEIQARYSETILKPKYLNEIKTIKTVNLNEELKLDNFNTTNSRAIINYYNITRYYKYNYEFCVKDTCNTSNGVISPDNVEYNKTLLVLYGTIIFDNNSLMYKSVKSNKNIYSMFIKLKYTKNNKTNIINVKDVTPKNLEDKIVLQTFNGIDGADRISLIFAFRNEEYIINLK